MRRPDSARVNPILVRRSVHRTRGRILVPAQKETMAVRVPAEIGMCIQATVTTAGTLARADPHHLRFAAGPFLISVGVTGATVAIASVAAS
jgi:hypothetical protein